MECAFIQLHYQVKEEMGVLQDVVHVLVLLSGTRNNNHPPLEAGARAGTMTAWRRVWTDSRSWAIS